MRQSPVCSIVFLILVLINCIIHYILIGITNHYSSATQNRYYLAFIGVSATLIIIFTIVQFTTYCNWQSQPRVGLSWLMCFFSLLFTFAIAIVLAITTSAIHLLERSQVGWEDTSEYEDYKRVHIADTVITWVISLVLLVVIFTQKTLDMFMEGIGAGGTAGVGAKGEAPITQIRLKTGKY